MTEPTYEPIDVEVNVRAPAGADPGPIERAVREAIERGMTIDVPTIEVPGGEVVHVTFPRNNRPTELPLPYVGDPGDPEAYRRSAEIDRTEADTYDTGDDRREVCLRRAVAWEELAAAITERTSAPELSEAEAATVARIEAAPPAFPIEVEVDERIPPGEAHLVNAAGETVGVITGLDSADEPDRPAPAAESIVPLPVLLDALAEVTAEASALKTTSEHLRRAVERRAIDAYAETGTDRYRRDSALITLRFDSDAVIVDDAEVLVDLLADLGVAIADVQTARVELNSAVPLDDLGYALSVLSDLASIEVGTPVDPMGVLSRVAGAATTILDAVRYRRELDPPRALAALEDRGFALTKAGQVIADTGEPVECIHVRRGAPSGVQVRCDDELKAARLADVTARLLP